VVPLTRGPISLGHGGMLQQSIGRKFPLCGSLHLFEYHNYFYWRMQKEGPNQLEKREPHDDWVLTIGKPMGAIWEGVANGQGSHHGGNQMESCSMGITCRIQYQGSFGFHAPKKASP